MADSIKVTSTLIAFDFDHTLIDANTDTYIHEISEDKGIKDDVRKWLQDGIGWTACMRLLFKRLHKEKFNPEQIVSHIQNLKIPEQRLRTLKFLSDQPSNEIIIISDSNTIFINSILKAHGIEKYFSRLYTNPASFNKDGLLEIEEYHQNATCPLSPSNMCKARILREHIASAGLDRSNLRVLYVGDGTGDFCAAKSLLAQDYVIARQGYSLAKQLSPLDQSGEVAAKVVVSNFNEDMEQFFHSIY